MRWEMYLDQTQGAGRVTLAIFLVCLGVMSWWYLIQITPWMERWRSKLTTGFWVLIAFLYFVMLSLVMFAWPEM